MQVFSHLRFKKVKYSLDIFILAIYLVRLDRLEEAISLEFIIPIKGAVKFTITLDPTVWIFDDRKIDLDDIFRRRICLQR